jgi:hypothetical protein
VTTDLATVRSEPHVTPATSVETSLGAALIEATTLGQSVAAPIRLPAQ